jgi:hypothetical protein
MKMGGGCKEAERTFVLVGGLESETPSSNLCTQKQLGIVQQGQDTFPR